jgi:hypothetical protein
VRDACDDVLDRICHRGLDVFGQQPRRSDADVDLGAARWRAPARDERDRSASPNADQIGASPRRESGIQGLAAEAIRKP